MPGIIGKKIGMTSVFDEEGKNIPCTVIEAGPCVVTQVKTKDNDGYDAVQLAFDDKPEKTTSKPMMGHFKKAKANPKRKIFEFQNFEDQEFNMGDQVDVNVFTGDVWVDVIGVSKGKGFQGVMKRHGFSGVNDKTHGQHDRNRAPGSLSGSSDPSRVFKGKRMAGHDGNARIKVLNLKVLKIIPENNLMIVKGSVPGAKGSYLIIND